MKPFLILLTTMSIVSTTSLHANALSAMVGLGNVWFVIPIILNFFSELIHGAFTNLFHDIIVLLLALIIPLLFFTISVFVDSYAIGTYIPTIAHPRPVAIIANIAVFILATIIFTVPIFASLFPALDIIFTWSLLVYPLIWLFIDIIVYVVVFYIFAPTAYIRVFFYRLLLIDIIPIIIFSVVIWLPFLLLLVHRVGGI